MFVFLLMNFFVKLGNPYGLNHDWSSEYEYPFGSHEYLRTKVVARENELDLSTSLFSVLENYQVDATPVTEKQFPWIARVVHSRTKIFPHMGTAACIDPGIFITAARSIFSLKVSYTSVVYKSKNLPAVAFVLPSNLSKQAFDDIGFIVVKSENLNAKEWSTIKLFDNIKRTDNSFGWFDTFSKGNISGQVVGYAIEKEEKIKQLTPAVEYRLTAIDVSISLDICEKILSEKAGSAYGVPCYFPCGINELKKCTKHHGVEGGAVFDKLTNKLMGVATWGVYITRTYELPVGFAFANSENFKNDFICAQRIKKASGVSAEGYFQSLC